MPEKYILKKDHLPALLRRLKKNSRLVAPVRNSHGDTLLAEFDSLENMRLDLENQPQTSAKPFLFPQQEVLFTYLHRRPDEYVFTPRVETAPTIFFGLRSCDLSAILYMDVIFLSRTRDPYYLQRRRNSIFITIGCNEPFPNCFCNATSSGPFLEFGFDLQLTDLGDRFFVEPGLAKGDNLIRRWRPFFTPASEEDNKAQFQNYLEARGRFQRNVHVDQAIKKLQTTEAAGELWEDFSRRCQDCGGCAYICPTCTCFTVTDRSLGPGEGERLRCWDACTFSGFTRMAGGHNPVDRRRHALRKRFLHKLKHDVEKHGRTSCMGCGRCVGICFGGVDMIRFVDMICEKQ